MSDLPHRTDRTIPVADHLWEALESMARDMGADRAALVNQALFTFARLNGYVIPGRPGALSPDSERPRLFEAPRGTDVSPGLSRENPALLPYPTDDLGSGAGSGLSKRATVPSHPADATLLVLVLKDREVEVNADRFLIGRGKHCDLVIESNRVSREHAVILREGDELTIEDLKSSNGTWIHQQRITRRKVQEGDEYLLGSEKVICQFRPVER